MRQVICHSRGREERNESYKVVPLYLIFSLIIRSSWEENESRKEFLEIRNLHCENISSFGGGGGERKGIERIFDFVRRKNSREERIVGGNSVISEDR